MFVFSIQVASCISVIPNLGYGYSMGYESGYWGVCEKNWIIMEKSHTSTHKFEITVPLLITNILLIWRLQFMEIGCQGVCKWKKGWEPLMYMICEKRVIMPKVYDLRWYFEALHSNVSHKVFWQQAVTSVFQALKVQQNMIENKWSEFWCIPLHCWAVKTFDWRYTYKM
jgi:hypothetical protein